MAFSPFVNVMLVDLTAVSASVLVAPVCSAAVRSLFINLSCQRKRPAFGTASLAWEVSASAIAALHNKRDSGFRGWFKKKLCTAPFFFWRIWHQPTGPCNNVTLTLEGAEDEPHCVRN